MQVQFKRPFTIGGHTYGVGTHYIDPESVKNDWFFDGLQTEGHVIILNDESEYTKEKQEEEPTGKRKK